jgi:mannose-6-phosphate isomerase-like protein (cupin superfamily)
MNKFIRLTFSVFCVFILVVLFSSLGSKSLAKNQYNISLKPQIFHVQSLFNTGLKDGDIDIKYSTLIHTDKIEVELKSLMGFPKHYHDHENHFIYVLKGKANLRIGSVKTLINTGDFIAIPPGKQYEHDLQVIGEPMQLLVLGTPPEE